MIKQNTVGGLTRYDLTQDVEANSYDITPVPVSQEGRFVLYEDVVALLSAQKPFGYVEAGAAVRLISGQIRFAALTTDPKKGRTGKTLALYTRHIVEDTE